jgi:hypothetical protein
MLGPHEMLGRVLVFRRIAAADMAAGQANSQMDPVIPKCDAFLAPGTGGSDGPYLIEVCAFDFHRSLHAIPQV